MAYLERIRHSPRVGRTDLWPSQLADFILGRFSFAVLLERAFKCMDLDELERRSYVEVSPGQGEGTPLVDVSVPLTGLLLRRHLAKALFYGGLKAWRANPAVTTELLVRCTRLRDVDVENEWYLAFLQLDLVPAGK